MNTNQTTTPIDITKVFAVYSGKADQCRCGCAGKYTYAKQYQQEAGERRGYAVTDDEVNATTVAKVVRFINEHIAEAEIFSEPGDHEQIVNVYFSPVREYTAYYFN
jgi:hypothetical protein